MSAVPYLMGANSFPAGALRSQYDHMVAKQFLEEAAYPPPESREFEAERIRWRERWEKWLRGEAPGPVGDVLAWHVRAKHPDLYWRAAVGE